MADFLVAVSRKPNEGVCFLPITWGRLQRRERGRLTYADEDLWEGSARVLRHVDRRDHPVSLAAVEPIGPRFPGEPDDKRHRLGPMGLPVCTPLRQRLGKTEENRLGLSHKRNSFHHMLFGFSVQFMVTHRQQKVV